MHGDTMREAAEIFAEGRRGSLAAGRFVCVQHEAWSYDERIAYRDDENVVYVTKEKFSVTTSKHVGAIRYALSRAGYASDGEEVDNWEVWRMRRRS